MNFEYWFTNHLKVDRFPTPGEISDSDAHIILNVSDEYIESCHTVAQRSQKEYFWFPMSEKTNDIGIHSIYGALQVLHKAEKNEQKVLLHCHGGGNRSVTVADAYYYLRTKTHRVAKAPDGNRLLANIYDNGLPGIRTMEKFLTQCEQIFNKDETTRAWQLTELIVSLRL